MCGVTSPHRASPQNRRPAVREPRPAGPRLHTSHCLGYRLILEVPTGRKQATKNIASTHLTHDSSKLACSGGARPMKTNRTKTKQKHTHQGPAGHSAALESKREQNTVAYSNFNNANCKGKLQARHKRFTRQRQRIFREPRT